MPKIIIETQDPWHVFGEDFSGTVESQLVLKLGELIPQRLLDEMQPQWKHITLKLIRVKFAQQCAKDINAPDVGITLQMGKKWEPHSERLVAYFTLLIIQWLQENYEREARPSFEFSIELMNWTGALVSREGEIIDEW